MIYFKLPQSPANIYKYIKIESTFEFPTVFLSQSLCFYMNDIKEKISSREKEWDFYKKYTNPYEYIHSIVPQKKKSVSKYKPISRSYFKMLEMIAEFDIAKPSFENCDFDDVPMRTFHLAEGPGGFIEAICNKRSNSEDKYFGMTIIFDENDDNVPAWNKSGYFLSQNNNIQLEYGIDGNGDVLNFDNFVYCVQKYKSSMDLITADGGFDFSKDFNRQEISITNLIWAQVCYALCLQKKGGNFVLKIFDIFYEHTANILYILASFYEEVYVCKLKTSRIGNSEKYVVCKKFRSSSCDDFYPILCESFENNISCKIARNNTNPLSFSTQTLKMNSEEIEKNNLRVTFESDFCIASHLNTNVVMPEISTNETISYFSSRIDNTLAYSLATTADNFHFFCGKSESTCNHILRLLSCKMPRYFTKCIEDINSVLGQQQIENIHYTISLMDKQLKQDKLEQLVKQNVLKCVN